MANSLRLNIPAQDLVDIKTLDPHPRHLNKWLATLHLANVKESAPRVLNVLRKYNRCQMEPSARYKAMNMLHPVLDELTDTIKNKYWGNYILLAEKHRAGNNTVNPFLEETAYGYKIIIADLIGEGKNYSLAPEILIESIYQSILYLSELILTSYLVNAPEPNGVWGELNRLYHFAEQAGFHKQTVAKDSEHSERKTIYHAYKKIVLLALANPYQLMPGEAATIFNYLNDWARGCHIVPAEQGTQIKGRFYVNLAGELSPKFAATPVNYNTAFMRILVIDRLLDEVMSQTRIITQHNNTDKKHTSMSMIDRMQRDMLMRLQKAWGGRQERMNERHENHSTVLLTAGLSATHYFISGEALFEPERDEIRYYRPSQQKPGSSFSLLPADHEPWKVEEREKRIESGVEKPRYSTFGNDDTELNVWEKIYSTQARSRTLFEAREPDFTAQIWFQTDESEGGLGLRREDAEGINIHVGDLIAFKHGIFDDEDWQIGTVRWLRETGRYTLELGIMSMAKKARAVAVRAIGGVGGGGEYFRSLIVPAQSEKTEVDTLIVPANIYDVGTRLVVNLKTEVIYVRLLRLLEATSSFSQFEYVAISMPDTERVNIEAIRDA